MIPGASNGSICVKNREYVSSIAAFALDQFGPVLTHYMNPGNSVLFPWLSTIATRYEKYSFRKLKFLYVTRSSANNSGSIIFSPEYDPNDQPPTTEQAAMSTNGAQETTIWRDLTCVLDPKCYGTRKRFVRDGAVAGDLSNYDAGNMNIILADCGSLGVKGKLLIEYEVVLDCPQTSLQHAPSSSTASQAYTAAQITVPSLTATAIPLDLQVVGGSVVNNPLGIAVDSKNATFETLRGAYEGTFSGGFDYGGTDAWNGVLQFLKNGLQIHTWDSISLGGSGTAAGTPQTTFPVLKTFFDSTGPTDKFSLLYTPTLGGSALRIKEFFKATIKPV